MARDPVLDGSDPSLLAFPFLPMGHLFAAP